MTTTPPRAMSCVWASLLLLPLAGCGLLDNEVSKDKLEAELAAWLKTHDLEATKISCPDKQKMEKGNKLECHCEIQGVDVPILVEVTDALTGAVEWEPKYLTITHQQIESEVQALPELAGRQLGIDCKTILVSVPDSEWACDVVDEAAVGQPLVLTLTFRDGKGTYDWTLEPKP